MWRRLTSIVIFTFVFLFSFTSYSQSSSEVFVHQESFQKVNRMIYQEVKKQLASQSNVIEQQDKFCKNAGSNKDKRVKNSQYKCGEYPFGAIVDQHKKKLFELKTKKIKRNIGGARVELNGFKIPLFMERNQKQGKIKLSLMDSKKVQMVKTTNHFDKNLLVRHIPDGDAHYLTGCYSLPGTRIYAPDTTLVARGVKKIFWFIKAKVKVISKLNIGGYQFDSINSCGVFRATLPITDLESAKNAQPRVELLRLVKPNVLGGKLAPLKVKKVKVSGNLVYKIIRFFGKLFGYNLDQMITMEIKKGIRSTYTTYSKTYKYKNISIDDVKKGRWAAKLMDGLLNDEIKISSSINKAIADSMRVRKPNSNLSFEKNLKGQCSDLVDRLDEKDLLGGVGRGKAFALCKRIVLDIELIPFYANPDYKKKGCFKHFASTYQFKNKSGLLKWWVEGCQLSAKLIVRMSYDSLLENETILSDARSCLAKAAKKGKLTSSCDRLVFDVIEEVKDTPISDLESKVKKGLPSEFLSLASDT